MREMAATGFMSNRGRQNVASYLALDLNHDWRAGADHFESQLVDYDVCSNWGNWVSAAGLTGGRLNKFNISKQSRDYDAAGDYLRTWLPELKNVPARWVHEPWRMPPAEQEACGCVIGRDYPEPLKGAAGGAGWQQQGQGPRRAGGQKGQKGSGARKGKGGNGRGAQRRKGDFEMYG